MCPETYIFDGNSKLYSLSLYYSHFYIYDFSIFFLNYHLSFLSILLFIMLPLRRNSYLPFFPFLYKLLIFQSLFRPSLFLFPPTSVFFVLFIISSILSLSFVSSLPFVLYPFHPPTYPRHSCERCVLPTLITFMSCSAAHTFVRTKQIINVFFCFTVQ